ncbi:hypothetical protein F7Q91_03060 [Vibrio chagasii]|uniref:Uncharacterized protein n=1 Tax=Vibrio chagasii TaxID=170679 RepID=A0A7V7TI04_9VIBR|nr:hypothetical protein [Vibrio chagasii]KAB0482401.1 hypothetical protein F7Q91_03060 [Vibrio chagasii]
MEEIRSKSTNFKSISEASEKITIAGSSTVPSQVKTQIDAITNGESHKEDSYLRRRAKRSGVNRNPFLAKRAATVLNTISYFCWALTIIFLAGATINFQLLEDIQISATSHDARIEKTSPPIKLKNLD